MVNECLILVMMMMMMMVAYLVIYQQCPIVDYMKFHLHNNYGLLNYFKPSFSMVTRMTKCKIDKGVLFLYDINITKQQTVLLTLLY
jgi:hypothetical protein